MAENNFYRVWERMLSEAVRKNKIKTISPKAKRILKSKINSVDEAKKNIKKIIENREKKLKEKGKGKKLFERKKSLREKKSRIEKLIEDRRKVNDNKKMIGKLIVEEKTDKVFQVVDVNEENVVLEDKKGRKFKIKKSLVEIT
jgi:hypothetical protein